MIPLIISPDLRQACLSLAHFPGDRDALEPSSTVSTGATLRADYECPCGDRWSCFWSAESPWPEPELSLRQDAEATGWPRSQSERAA